MDIARTGAVSADLSWRLVRTSWILNAPIKALGDDQVSILRTFTRLKVLCVRQPSLEQLFGIRDGPFLKEIVLPLGEAMPLAIVHEHGTLVDNRHLCETLLRVQ